MIRRMMKLTKNCIFNLDKNMFGSTKTSINDTIYALSSGVNTAISIVRISGPEAFRAIQLTHKNQQHTENSNNNFNHHFGGLAHRTLTLKSIYNSKKGLIDRAMVAIFEKGKSYSREEMVELHLHGSKAVVSAVFEELNALGFRMAERGQFTKRAILNGAMSMHEAEAINDLINSQLEFERQIAVNNLLGKNINFIAQLRLNLLKTLAKMEAFIEFHEVETGVSSSVLQQVKKEVGDLIRQLKRVSQNSKMLQSIKDGVEVAIVGRPNVGKSTLMNGLAKRDISIVSEIAGTTRDIIESSVQTQGFRLNLIDTAGLRESDCVIEVQGIRRAKNRMQGSHIKLIVIDLRTSNYEEEQSTISIFLEDYFCQLVADRRSIFLVNKADQLPDEIAKKEMFVVWEAHKKRVDLAISAHRAEDLKQVMSILEQKLRQQFSLYENNCDQIFFTRARYIQHLNNCINLLSECLKEPYPDISCMHLRQAIHQLSEMIGQVNSQQVLDALFSQFCIGK